MVAIVFLLSLTLYALIIAGTWIVVNLLLVDKYPLFLYILSDMTLCGYGFY